MTNKLILEQFTLIQEKVEKLILNLKNLEAENHALKSQVEQLESDLISKRETEQNDQAIKDQIRERVDALMQKLEEITVAGE